MGGYSVAQAGQYAYEFKGDLRILLLPDFYRHLYWGNPITERIYAAFNPADPISLLALF